MFLNVSDMEAWGEEYEEYLALLKEEGDCSEQSPSELLDLLIVPQEA